MLQLKKKNTRRKEKMKNKKKQKQKGRNDTIANNKWNLQKEPMRFDDNNNTKAKKETAFFFLNSAMQHLRIHTCWTTDGLKFPNNKKQSIKDISAKLMPKWDNLKLECQLFSINRMCHWNNAHRYYFYRHSWQFVIAIIKNIKTTLEEWILKNLPHQFIWEVEETM